MSAAERSEVAGDGAGRSRHGAPVREERVRQWSLRDPLFYVQIVVILLLCVLIVYPAVILLERSFRDDSGAFSLRLVRPGLHQRAQSLRRSSTRSSSRPARRCWRRSPARCSPGPWCAPTCPAAGWSEMASIVPFISTSFIGALAWILLGSPETGLDQPVLALSRRRGGADRHLSRIEGIIFVIALYEMPFVFLLVGGALRSMDPALEEASLSSGAGLWRTTIRVTLPLVLPAILASSLLVFVLAAEQFGVPAVLGTPARIRVLTTSIVETQHLLSAAARPRRGALRDAAGRSRWSASGCSAGCSATAPTPRSAARARSRAASRSGRSAGCCSASACFYLLLAVVLPFSTIFLSSIRTIWTADFRWEQFTLRELPLGPVRVSDHPARDRQQPVPRRRRRDRDDPVLRADLVPVAAHQAAGPQRARLSQHAAARLSRRRARLSACCRRGSIRRSCSTARSGSCSSPT